MILFWCVIVIAWFVTCFDGCVEDHLVNGFLVEETTSRMTLQNLRILFSSKHDVSMTN